MALTNRQKYIRRRARELNITAGGIGLDLSRAGDKGFAFYQALSLSEWEWLVRDLNQVKI